MKHERDILERPVNIGEKISIDNGEGELEKLMQEGIIFDRMPNNFPTGSPYITQADLVKSESVKYSSTHLLKMIRDGIIPASEVAEVGGQIILSPRAALLVLERQRRRLASSLPGAKPGRRSRRRLTTS